MAATSGPVGVVLAAGAGRRFGGGRKQLAELRGRPLLEHALIAMADSELRRRLVVLGSGADEILARVDLHGAEPLWCADWEEGRAAALRVGFEAGIHSGASAILVTLADQPLISPRAIDRLAAEHLARPDLELIHARYGRRTGHPVLIAAELAGPVSGLQGDTGAAALRGVRAAEVDCSGLGDPADADTPGVLATIAAAPRR